MEHLLDFDTLGTFIDIVKYFSLLVAFFFIGAGVLDWANARAGRGEK